MCSKRVLLLGSGFVAPPCAEYIIRKGHHLTIGCRTLSKAEELAVSTPGAVPVTIDVLDSSALDALISQHDLVISLIPFIYHVAVIESAIRNKVHVVTTSFVSPAMMALDQRCRDANIIVFNEIGVDPGIDHLYAIKTISEVHAAGGKIKAFWSYCGAMPAPECANNALRYKFSWSARGSLLALQNSARYIKHGQMVEVDGKDLMKSAIPVEIAGMSFAAYPNRDSTGLVQAYNIPEAETCGRSTMRYEGFPDVSAAWVEMGLLDSSESALVTKNGVALPWIEVVAKLLGTEVTEASVIAKISSLKSCQPISLGETIIAKTRSLGLFSHKLCTPKGSMLDTLCASLEEECKYVPGERDLVLLHHKFVVERADGSIETLTSTMEAYGSKSGGPSAMALTVGLPCAVAVQAILDGRITRTGIQQPYDEATCSVLRLDLEKEGIVVEEKTL